MSESNSRLIKRVECSLVWREDEVVYVDFYEFLKVLREISIVSDPYRMKGIGLLLWRNPGIRYVDKKN